jgi:hypothetical protein
MRGVTFVAMLGILVGGCSGGGGSPAPAPSATPVPLRLFIQATPTSNVLLVDANGTPPYNGTVYGSCGTLGSVGKLLAFTGTSGVCVVSVADATGQVRAAAMLISPVRADLTASIGSGADPQAPLVLALGASLPIVVSETLVGTPFRTPYVAIVQGSCASVSGANGAFTLSATNAGRCVVVFSDSAGQAIERNIDVSSPSSTIGVTISG